MAFASPVPWPPGKVNGFVQKLSDGWVLIDGGLGTAVAEQALDQCLDRLKLRPDQVREIWCTHVHPDHLGLAARIGNRHDLPVWVPQSEITLLDGNWDSNKIASALREAFAPLGAPLGVIDTAAQFLAQIYNAVPAKTVFAPHPKDGRFQLIQTPGHSPGHVSFLTGNIIFGGDALEVAGYQGPEEVFLRPGQPFRVAQDYLRTFAALAQYQQSEWLSGHQSPMVVGEVLQKAKTQFDKMLRRVSDVVKAQKKITPYQIFCQAFPNTPDLFAFARLPFVMSLTATEFLTS